MLTMAASRGDAAAAHAEGAPAAGAREATALIVTDGEWIGLRVPLGDAPLIVGRGADADLQIKDPTVSRHHCVIWRAAGRCWVRDLGSMNHTRVNNRLASTAELFEGDVVVIGQTALTVASGPDAARTPLSNARSPE